MIGQLADKPPNLQLPYNYHISMDRDSSTEHKHGAQRHSKSINNNMDNSKKTENATHVYFQTNINGNHSSVPIKSRRDIENQSLLGGNSPLRPLSYVKYPSPFPEDNIVQTYSGMSNSDSKQVDQIHNGPSPAGSSKEGQDAVGNSAIIGSGLGLVGLGGNPGYQGYSFAASQPREASSDDFPGLLGAPPIQYSSLSGPAFLTLPQQTYTAVAGATAVLTCTIRNLHNYTVSGNISPLNVVQWDSRQSEHIVVYGVLLIRVCPIIFVNR